MSKKHRFARKPAFVVVAGLCTLSLVFLFQNCGGRFESQSSTTSLLSSTADPQPAAEPELPSGNLPPPPDNTARSCAHPDSSLRIPAAGEYVFYTRQSGTLVECNEARLTSLCDARTGLLTPPVASSRHTICTVEFASSASFPAWRRGMVPGQWKEIPNTSMSSAVPKVVVPGSLRGRIDAWNGLAANAATNRLYSAGSGGHADYSGNETIEIDLSIDQPKWTILREPTAPEFIRKSDYNKKEFFNYYLDGRPSSTHTYYALQFIASRNSIFKFGAGSIWGTGNEGNNKTDAFSLSTNDWVPEGTYPDINPSGGWGADITICKNTVTEEVYIAAPNGILRFNPQTAKYTRLAGYIQNHTAMIARACAVDPVRNRLVFFGDLYKQEQYPNGGLVLDLATNVLSEIKFTGPAAPIFAINDNNTAITKDDTKYISWTQASAWYDAAQNAFLLKIPRASKLSGIKSDEVVAINPIDFSTSAIQTTGGENLPDSINGIYTRFQQLPGLKGYVIYPAYSSNLWFLATE